LTALASIRARVYLPAPLDGEYERVGKSPGADRLAEMVTVCALPRKSWKPTDRV